MVTGRPEPAERETAVGEQSLGRVDSPARGMKGGLPGTGAGDGVEVDHPAAASRELLDRLDVARVMHPQELLALGGRSFDDVQSEPVTLGHRLLDRNQAPGILGMSARVVLEGARMSEVDAGGQGLAFNP